MIFILRFLKLCFFNVADGVLEAWHQVRVKDHGETVRQLKKRVEELERLQMTDPLTGLMSKSFFEQRAEAELYNCRAKEQPVTLGFIDLDGFKNVNDGLGHEKADVLLTLVASQLRKLIRPYDLSGRRSGDEFYFLLKCTNYADANIARQRLQSAINQQLTETLKELAREDLSSGCSIGLASTSEKDHNKASLKELIKIAEERMMVQKAENHRINPKLDRKPEGEQ